MIIVKFVSLSIGYLNLFSLNTIQDMWGVFYITCVSCVVLVIITCSVVDFTCTVVSFLTSPFDFSILGQARSP